METATESPTYLLGRQPILDRNEEVVGFELLFRSVGSRDRAEFSDASFASSHVILHTLSAFGLEKVLGGHSGFFNVTHDVLESDAIDLLPKQPIVLELLESVKITPDLVRRCAELKERGFTFALDDHQFDIMYQEMYGIAEIVKIDLLQSTVADVQEMVTKFRPYPVKLLAEKVESRQDFLRCLDLGFEFFQGYYFAKPSLLEKKRVDESVSILLKLMRLLLEDARIDEIEQTFRRSPGLTYKLLLLVNSVSIGMRTKINSIRHALVILGRRQVQRWVQLSLFASDNHSGISPLMEMAAVRGGFMEQLARRHPVLSGDSKAGDRAFMAGILSLMEKIYDMSIHDVVTELNLSDEVREALVSRMGLLGSLLKLAEAVDDTYSVATAEQLEELGVSHEDVLTAQVDAYQWLTAEGF